MPKEEEKYFQGYFVWVSELCLVRSVEYTKIFYFIQLECEQRLTTNIYCRVSIQLQNTGFARTVKIFTYIITVMMADKAQDRDRYRDVCHNTKICFNL